MPELTFTSDTSFLRLYQGNCLEPLDAIYAQYGDGRVDLSSGNRNSPGTLTVLTNAAAFLPRLILKRSRGDMVASCPAIWTAWRPQQNTTLASGSWTIRRGVIGNDGNTRSATNSSSVGNRFFRLPGP